MDYCVDSEDDSWPGYNFNNFYSDCITKNIDDLKSIFLNYNYNNKLIIIAHEIYFNSEKQEAGKYPYDKKLYYYIKVPKKGLTYIELFKQIDEQSKQYNDDLYNDDHDFISNIHKKTDIEYHLECGR